MPGKEPQHINNFLNIIGLKMGNISIVNITLPINLTALLLYCNAVNPCYCFLNDDISTIMCFTFLWISANYTYRIIKNKIFKSGKCVFSNYSICSVLIY